MRESLVARRGVQVGAAADVVLQTRNLWVVAQRSPTGSRLLIEARMAEEYRDQDFSDRVQGKAPLKRAGIGDQGAQRFQR